MKQLTIRAGLAGPAVLLLCAAPTLARSVSHWAGSAVVPASPAAAPIVSAAAPNGSAVAPNISAVASGLEREEPPVPRLETAKAQLEHASGLKLAQRGTEGEAQAAAREASVRAYRAVREYFAGDAKACAEAAFRAGEILRAANDAPAALAEFKVARERGADTPFRVRAMLEIGHLHRRTRRAQDALAAYEAVLSDNAATPGQKDDASYWAGHAHAELARPQDALRAWQRVADGAEDPMDRVRGWDCIALAWVGKGDLEAAAGALDRCREALSEVAAEETRLGERVRNALASMRAVDELQRAVEERAKARAGEKKVRGG